MAKCMRFALSVPRKVMRMRNSFAAVQKFGSHFDNCQFSLQRQFSNAVISSHLYGYNAVRATSAHIVCNSRRQLQTEVDKELSKFLEKEISYEESASNKKNVKGVQGFEVTLEDAEVKLTRKLGNEVIVVKFNINATVDAEGPLPAGEQEQQESEMVSRPPFTVELCKGDGRLLSMQCVFVHPEEIEQQEGPQDAEAIVDSFEIQEVALHKGEWKETIYSVSAEIMDGNLYDLLMDMLDERGINEEFANQLIDFSTSYEHSRYLHFLKDLKNFVEK